MNNVSHKVSSPFLKPVYSVPGVMATVLLALLPAAICYTWFFGAGFLINLLITSTLGLLLEALVMRARGKPVFFYLGDLSILVTAALLSFALPPGSPWWIATSGIFIACVFGKHVFGGLGHNIFNPAALAYVSLLILFPLQMTGWYLPGSGSYAEAPIDPLSAYGVYTSLQLSFPWLRDFALTPFPVRPDGFATATPLIEYKFAAPSRILMAEPDGFTLWERGARTGWEMLSVSFALGGLFLLWRGIISWHIPFTVVAVVFVLSSLFYQPGQEAIFGSPWLHLFSTSTLIGAFFIATDPASSPSSALGKVIYGALIGIAMYSIRIWGSYLDSVALAILAVNMCSPLIDQLTARTPLGHPSRVKRWLSAWKKTA
ncbi:MAG: RnfABCDGE type electron transport complex subunit D [Pseudohongiella sp.]|nr:RnfABCDGE type electron transport complex subunit D [Pseudohongiella sp.]